MEYKKEFYILETLFEKKQYELIITKSISIFETGLKRVFKGYIDSVKNINDKRNILTIINDIGKNSITLENMDFGNLIELEERLNIFFNLKKDQQIDNLRVDIINLKGLNTHKARLLYNKALTERIDAEVFLCTLKIFLIDFNLIEPLFTRERLCENCGNNIPNNKQTCPFCDISIHTEKKDERTVVKTLNISGENQDQILEQFVSRIRSKIEKIEKNQMEFLEAQFFNNSTLIYIPEGNFYMGTDSEKSFPKERPSHYVDLVQYWISKHEITFSQYENFCRDTERMIPFDNNWGKEERPVINVSWFDANAYCEWMSVKTGLVFRLPTEAEWEKASKGKENNLYPWGNETPNVKHANYNYHIGKTTEVGSFSEGISQYGLFDMSGNIREWCLDWYDEQYYKDSPKFNPKGPKEGDFKVIRGGGWGYDETFLRTTDRNRWIPDDSSNEIGFRIVLEAK